MREIVIVQNYLRIRIKTILNNLCLVKYISKFAEELNNIQTICNWSNLLCAVFLVTEGDD